MNRFQQKCMIASAGVHLLLAVVLVVGPGFLSPSAKPVDVAPITFVPSIFVDGPPGGGNPKAGQPVATPPKPPAPEPKPAPPEPKPEPEREKAIKPEPKEEPKDKDAFAISEKHHKPVVSLKEVVRPRKRPKNTEESDADTKAQEQERRDYERRQQVASLLGRAASDIKSGTGAATTLAGDPGVGGGGKAYASYAAWVLTVFDNAWIAPDDATSEDATTKARVVIDSDGSVVDFRIIERSGDHAVDDSVQRALERVARSGMGKPFPSSMKDKQKTYIIPFNLKNKRGTA